MISRSKASAPPYLPLRTIVKWFENRDERNHNKLISKTIGKILIINQQWLDDNPEAPRPQDQEFWLVDVVDEKRPGEKRGCFICNPLRRVEFSSLTRLLPGMYTEHWHGRFLVLEPLHGGVEWILPHTHKLAIRDIYAVAIRQ